MSKKLNCTKIKNPVTKLWITYPEWFNYTSFLSFLARLTSDSTRQHQHHSLISFYWLCVILWHVSVSAFVFASESFLNATQTWRLHSSDLVNRSSSAAESKRWLWRTRDGLPMPVLGPFLTCYCAGKGAFTSFCTESCLSSLCFTTSSVSSTGTGATIQVHFVVTFFF